VTVAAVMASPTVDKLYFSVRSAAFRQRVERARTALPGESPRPSSGRPPRPPTPASSVTTVVPTAPFALVKHKALAAHASQLAGSHWLNYPDAVVAELFSDEAFIRHLDRSGAPLPEDDLFAGLR
jgi:LmbE family N-acetylglucosaminyl deacetylase